MSSVLAVEPSLVGRDKEIKRLNQLLSSVMNGIGTTVFIGGEVGVGKTRLVNEFLTQAKEKGITVLTGWCLSQATIPYFPFTEAFNTYISTIKDETTKDTMIKHLGITGWLKSPQIPESKPLSDARMERDRTFSTVAQTFLKLSSILPVVLFLDDLQWADPLSLALIHYLARKCRNSRLLIIGAYRLEEVVPTIEGSLHPLQETMFSMNRDGLSTMMELNRLTRKDLSELLTSIFHSSLGEEFVEKLYMETEGNPLFILETLNMLVVDGYLAEKEGFWMLSTTIEGVGIPSKVHEVVLRRLSRLSREERRLLDLAAVCGRTFHIGMLRESLALDITEVLERLIEIEQRHRLVRSVDSTFEFTHQQIRDVIYETMNRELRRIYHLKTAQYLEKIIVKEVSNSNLVDVANHYVNGGASGKAFDYLIKLGENALNIFANRQAIDYLTEALEATEKHSNLATSENLHKIYLLRSRAWMMQEETPFYIRNPKARSDRNLLLQLATNSDDENQIALAHMG